MYILKFRLVKNVKNKWINQLELLKNICTKLNTTTQKVEQKCLQEHRVNTMHANKKAEPYLHVTGEIEAYQIRTHRRNFCLI